MNRCPFVSAAPRKPVSFSKLNAPWQLLNAFASAQFRNCLRLRSSLQAFSNLYNILSPLESSFILCLIQFTGKSSNMPELNIFGLQFCAEHPWEMEKKTTQVLSLSSVICTGFKITKCRSFFDPLFSRCLGFLTVSWKHWYLYRLQEGINEHLMAVIML